MSKYSYGQPNAFNTAPNDSGIQIGVVKSVGKIIVNKEIETQRKSDERFNADPAIIRCKINGASWDKDVATKNLTNCFPLLPKHLNVVPKVGEAVLIFTFDDGTKYADRFYLGPIISSPLTLKNDALDKTALAGLSVSPVTPNVDVDTIKDAQGVFPELSDIALQGRDNSDIIFKENQAILRAGQHVFGDNKIFNKSNPAYIQLNFNVPTKKGSDGKDELGSVANIVANKINLLTHKGGSPRYTLTTPDEYITNDELLKIVSEAHPLVFGDTLIEYLKKLEHAFMNHVHRFNGLKPSSVDGENFIKEYLEYALELMLSKNIKIN